MPIDVRSADFRHEKARFGVKARSEFALFDATVRKVISVSREELKRREEQWKRQHGERKAGRKSSKISPASRASTGKD